MSLLLLIWGFVFPCFEKEGLPHDFHVSKCLVEYREAERTFQVSLHLFIDDLESALAQGGATQLFLCTGREAPEAEAYLQRYLQRHFKLSTDGTPLAFQFIGKEASDDLQAVWCYLEYPDAGAFRELTLTNSVLMDLFDDQKNIVTVIGPGHQKGMLLFERDRRTETISF